LIILQEIENLVKARQMNTCFTMYNCLSRVQWPTRHMTLDLPTSGRSVGRFAKKRYPRKCNVHFRRAIL